MQYQYLDLDFTGSSTGASSTPWKYATGTDGFIDNNSTTWTDDITVYVKGGTTYLETTNWDLGTDKLDMGGYSLYVMPWPASSQECAIDQTYTGRYTIDSQIHIEQPNIFFVGIQLSYSNSGSESYPFLVRARNYTGTSGLYRCRVLPIAAATTEARIIQIAAGTGVVLNIDECVIEGGGGTGQTQGYGCYDLTGTNTLNVRNSDVFGWYRGTRNCNIENSAVFANDVADNYNPGTEDYVASDDGNGTNPVSPSGASWGNELTDYANGDLTIIPSGNCYAGGKDMSAYYTEDLPGETITQNSIGAMDHVVSGDVTRSLSDNINVYDDNKEQSVLLRLISETASIFDGISSVVSIEAIMRSLSENIAVNDNEIIGENIYTRLINDSISIFDFINKIHFIVLNDSTNVNDNVKSIKFLLRNLLTNIGVYDYLSQTIGSVTQRKLNEIIDVYDASTKYKTAIRLLIEQYAYINDSISSNKANVRKLSDNINVSDLIFALKSVKRLLSENVDTNDDITSSVIQTLDAHIFILASISDIDIDINVR